MKLTKYTKLNNQINMSWTISNLKVKRFYSDKNIVGNSTAWPMIFFLYF